MRNSIPFFKSNKWHDQVTCSMGNICLLCFGFPGCHFDYLEYWKLHFCHCIAWTNVWLHMSSWPWWLDTKKTNSCCHFFLLSYSIIVFCSESYSLVVLICVKERYYLGGNQRCLVWSKKARLPSFVLPAGCLLRAAVLVLGVNNTVLEELWFMWLI